MRMVSRAHRCRRAARAGQLTLGEQRDEPDAREPEDALVDEVARLPAGEELRVEAVEALDLEERVGERQRPSENAVANVLLVLHDPGEGGEVQGELLHTALAEQLDRAHDEKLGEPVRAVALTSHA